LCVLCGIEYFEWSDQAITYNIDEAPIDQKKKGSDDDEISDQAHHSSNNLATMQW